MKLLSTNYKTSKSKGINVDNYILPLEPDYILCPLAKKAGCGKTCIVNSGLNKTPTAKSSKARKTDLFYNNFDQFKKDLVSDHNYLQKNRIYKGFEVASRLNGYSDIQYEKIKIKDDKTIFELFPDIQFYDYTKIANRDIKDIPNYHLTFSYTKSLHRIAIKQLEKGQNIAIVLDIKKDDPIPTDYIMINNKKYNLIDGDKNDLRYKDPKNSVVALRFKGSKKDKIEAYKNGLIYTAELN